MSQGTLGFKPLGTQHTTVDGCPNTVASLEMHSNEDARRRQTLGGGAALRGASSSGRYNEGS